MECVETAQQYLFLVHRHPYAESGHPSPSFNVFYDVLSWELFGFGCVVFDRFVLFPVITSVLRVCVMVGSVIALRVVGAKLYFADRDGVVDHILINCDCI